MAAQLKEFTESAQGFSRSPLGIIALFIVLVYGFASLVVGLGNNLSEHITPLIYFLVFFPVIVFFGFLWLVSTHHDKIYGPADFKSDEGFHTYTRMDMETAASLALAMTKDPDGRQNSGTAQEQLSAIVETVSRAQVRKTHEKPATARKRILWVDDRPENNIYERKAFESQGIETSLAHSTQEALQLLRRQQFAAVISDMGRREGGQEGYRLLEELRTSGDKTPFFLYAGSNKPEHQRMAREKGAQGSTNRAKELYEMVMKQVTD